MFPLMVGLIRRYVESEIFMEQHEQSIFELTWEDLRDMKKICKAILETNIALKTFQNRHADTEEHLNMGKLSIANSKKALTMLDNIENCESINDVIRRGVGDRNWALFVMVLGAFSGSLSDPKFYEFDKQVTKDKRKEMN